MRKGENALNEVQTGENCISQVPEETPKALDNGNTGICVLTHCKQNVRNRHTKQTNTPRIPEKLISKPELRC